MAISLPIVSKFDDKGVNQAESGLEKLKGFAKGAGIAVAASLAVAGAAAVAFGVEAVKAAAEAEAITRGLENAAKNAGVFGDKASSINKATEALDKHSKSLGELTGIDDEIINQIKTGWLAVPSLAALGVDGLNNLAKVTADIAAGTGKDITAIALAFQRVAGDTESAFSKLTRAGIVFTDEQKATFDSLLATNGEMAAQQYLVEQLGAKYEGAAAAAANPFERLNVIFGNLNETIGAALLPAFEILVPQFQSLIEDMVASPEFEQFMEDLALHSTSLANSLPGVVTNIGSFLKDFFPVIEASGALAAAVVNSLAGGFESIEGSDPATPTNNFASAMRNLAGGINATATAIDDITRAWNDIPETLRFLISPLFSGIDLGDIRMPSGATFAETLGYYFGGGFATGQPYPGQAEGGTTIRPGLSWVGENGPELMQMPRGASIIPLDRISSQGRSSTQIVVNVNAGMGTDGVAVGRQIVEQIKKYERVSGKVFVSA